MTLLGLLLLIVAGGLAYLSEVDRASALALSIVEWDTRAGAPLYAIAGGAGALLLALGLLSRRSAAPKPAPAPARPPRPAAPPSTGYAMGPGALGGAAPAAPDGAWVPGVIQAAQNLPLEVGATLRLDAAAGVPFLLILDGLTPEGERRSLDIFAHFLASIPTPPRARVRFERHGAGGVLPQPLVNGAMRRAMPGGRFQAMNHEDQVEILFAQPDPCWQARPYLFLDRG